MVRFVTAPFHAAACLAAYVVQPSAIVTLSGAGTAGNTSPHADSRGMRFSASGDLIRGDDGGVYRRTSPRTAAGDWYSLNGNLQVTEFHSLAWDSVSSVMLGGTQDNDTPQQVTGNEVWGNVGSGGGVVAVDPSSTPGLTTAG